MRIIYDIEARKTLARHDKRLLLMSKIEQLAADPASLRNNILPLRGRVESRLRVGDWRIIFRVTDDTLFIDAIGPRGDVYE